MIMSMFPDPSVYSPFSPRLQIMLLGPCWGQGKVAVVRTVLAIKVFYFKMMLIVAQKYVTQSKYISIKETKN